MGELNGEGNWDDLVAAVSDNAADLSAAQPRSAIVTARATGKDVHNPRGEDRSCGDGVVQCATAEVIVESGADIVKVVRDAAEAGSTTFYEDPYPAIGWCWWQSAGYRALPDGRIAVFAQLKNWVENRDRQARLRVWVRGDPGVGAG